MPSTAQVFSQSVRHWLRQRWRRLVMQAVLWGVLAATVALAALITREKQQALRVKLDPAQVFGKLRVSLPHKWAVSSGIGGPEGGDAAYAEEMLPGGEPGRRLTIARRRLNFNASFNGPQVSPLEYVVSHGLLSGVLGERELMDGVRRGEIQVEPVSLAGWPAVLAEQNPNLSTQHGTVARKELVKELVACAILPSSQAVYVRIEGPGIAEEADHKLLEQMSEAVSVIDVPPPPSPGGTMELFDRAFGIRANIQANGAADAGSGTELNSGESALPADASTHQTPTGLRAALTSPSPMKEISPPEAMVTLKVPRHFYAIPCDDPNRTSRDIIADESAEHWMSAELIPCLFLPGDGEEAFRAMLLARNRDWHPGAIKPLASTRGGFRTWQADTADESQFASRAYLVAAGDGPALLAIFHGGLRASRDDFDAVWLPIAAGVTFADGADGDGPSQVSAEHSAEIAAPESKGLLKSAHSLSGRMPRARLQQMFRDGAAEAGRLSEAGLTELLPRAGYQGWSLWDEADNADKMEWMELSWATSGEGNHASWRGDRWTPLPNGVAAVLSPGSASRTHQQWSGSGDQRLYSTTGSRESRPGGRGTWGAAATQQQVMVEAGRLRVSVPPMKFINQSIQLTPPDASPPRAFAGDDANGDAGGGTNTGHSAGGAATGNSTEAPPEYVPGGWLPLLLPHISADMRLRMDDRPMLLRSDSFVGCDALPLPSWLLLEVWTDADLPPKLDERGDAMGCVTVCINGTGRLSRWYFTQSSEASRQNEKPGSAIAPASNTADTSSASGASKNGNGGDTERGNALRYADFADGLRARQDPEKRVVEIAEPRKTEILPQPQN